MCAGTITPSEAGTITISGASHLCESHSAVGETVISTPFAPGFAR